MKVFITGGSSVIGHSLISKLLDHGYEIHALSGTDGQANEMASIGAIPTFGDILVRESLREAMLLSTLKSGISWGVRIGCEPKQSTSAERAMS